MKRGYTFLETSFTDKIQPYDETGIKIYENERDSYIYICGIKPTRKIFINNNITLMPVSASANPDDMIDSFMKYGNGNEFQMGILISTLRMVTAQLRITAENPKTLAIQTWNAQHICVQISALLNCELAWYFQASDSADKFNSRTRLSMIYPNMYKCPTNLTIIDEEKCACLEQNISVALTLENDSRYENASNALWCYRMHFRPSVQLSILWGGIESLFLIEKSIKKNLSLSISRFIYGNDSMAEEIKTLYESRCKAVHELKNSKENILQKSVNLLHQLIVKCVQNNSLPNVSKLLKDE